ncbi:TPA: anthranilate phosphoribosyltransferase, partial [Candidatus Poribacteria bacterium]|nr:anthranilate phosphoribosyltransferase [Candidatus Poribacteria bacterium]HEX29330.1 anthranilate phosphoribosyltransferase [Candidatus Poribacteria bacterium]
DGLDEISILGRTSIAEVKNGKVEKYEIEPEDFGIPRCDLEEVAGGSPEFNARVIRDIFEGRDRGPRYNFLLLNSGAALYVGEMAESLEEGIERAREVIESGAAARKLGEYIARSNELRSKG